MEIWIWREEEQQGFRQLMRCWWRRFKWEGGGCEYYSEMNQQTLCLESRWWSSWWHTQNHPLLLTNVTHRVIIISFCDDGVDDHHGKDILIQGRDLCFSLVNDVCRTWLSFFLCLEKERKKEELDNHIQIIMIPAEGGWFLCRTYSCAIIFPVTVLLSVCSLFSTDLHVSVFVLAMNVSCKKWMGHSRCLPSLLQKVVTLLIVCPISL